MINLTDPTLQLQVRHEFGSTNIIANSPDDRMVAMTQVNVVNLQIPVRNPDTNFVSDFQSVPDVEALPTTATMGQLRELAFSPDGEWLISGYFPGGYRIHRKKGEPCLPVSVIPAQMPNYNARVVYTFTSEHKRALLLGSDFCHLIDLAREEPKELEAPADLQGVLDICTTPNGSTWAATKYITGARHSYFWDDGLQESLFCRPRNRLSGERRPV